MYSDPRHIRKHLVPVRVNDRNNEILEDMATKHGKQKATIAHELLELALRQAAGDLDAQNKKLMQCIGLLS